MARGFNPPMTSRLWRDRIVPRLTIPIFWVYWILLLPAGLIRGRKRETRSTVAIESGRVGWTHVYFEELWASAAEYLTSERLRRVVIDRDRPYLPQFREWSADTSLSHAVLDVRTGAQTWPRAMVDMLVVSWRLRRRRITPVVVLTDASLRRHRLQAAVVTAFDGVVVTFMAAELVAPMFPHRRIIGPLPMPVSASRLEQLTAIRRMSPTTGSNVSFIGGVYPPRSLFLERLEPLLARAGIRLHIHGSKYTTSNEDYWRVLATSDVIVTTTMQGMPRQEMDWIWIQQLVFRFSEALAAGAVLVAPQVAGGERFFAPGSDYASFVSVEDAARAITELVRDSHARERVRVHGHATGVQLSLSHTFWAVIDEALKRRF